VEGCEAILAFVMQDRRPSGKAGVAVVVAVLATALM
jgi:hypothetical protein